MSSYLNFYLIPKKERVKSDPLLLQSYPRNSAVYDAFREYLNPVFIGNGEEYNYQDLTTGDVEKVISNLENVNNKNKQTLANMTEAYNSVKDTLKEYLEYYASSKELIQEIDETISELKFIKNLVGDIQYSDFEKVLINID